MGVEDRKIVEVAHWRTSDAFDDDDRLVLELSDAMTSTPADVPDDLRARLDARFTRGQVAELVLAIAWENHRARLNRALGVRPAGFSDGAVCPLPVQETDGG